MKPLDWLNPALIMGPKLVLILSAEDFGRALDELGIQGDARPAPWLKSSHNGCVHFVTSARGEHANIVCIGGLQGYDPIEVAGLLVHESVHCWQNTCAAAGEREPSEEFEAYSIQNISMRLMDSYSRQMGWSE